MMSFRPCLTAGSLSLLLAAAAGHTAETARLSLAANRDTIIGTHSIEWMNSGPEEWTPERYVRIYNRGNAPVTLDSLTHAPVYRKGSGRQSDWSWVYQIRRFGPGAQMHTRTVAWGSFAPMILAPKDSVDFGLFQVGSTVIGKRSAVPIEADYKDTVTVPFAIHAGKDSLALVLKTEIGTTSLGSGIRVQANVRDPESATGAVRPDGRLANAGFAQRRGWIPVRITRE